MHGRRVAYYIIGEGVFPEDFATPGGQDGGAPPSVPSLQFGRLFGRTECAPRPEERDRMIQKLVRLGLLMNEPVKSSGQPSVNKGESDIPAGYTYLGQFIAHEITHDSTGDLLQAGLRPENLSTPEIDLDSLYGGEDGPKKRPELYLPDGVHLRTGRTRITGDFNEAFRNDLPRGVEAGPDGTKANGKQALLGDPRNDENLALAQTHVAFIRFHNKVVDKIRDENEDLDAAKVFELARAEVIRHYQWIILRDFLPRLVRADVLDCVMRHGLRWFKGDDVGGLFIPLEFSAAAFRIGHSMVRDAYEWNPRRRTGSADSPAPRLINLFEQTGSIKNGLDGLNSLKSNWIIDWRHFYDFTPLGRYLPLPEPPPQNPPVRSLNMSAKLDTVFDMHLDTVTGFPDEKIDKMQKAITVRNLLRGFYLGLPTGEEAAEWIGETALTRKQIASGPHEELLDDSDFWGKTPLWYYILKEAELLGFGPDGNPGNRLGPVGGRIVAETLIGLIKQSRYSILKDAGWRPTLGRRANSTEEPAKFEMIDLLDFADVVSPVAAYDGELYIQQP
jgi:hypothetical protein